MYTRSSPRPTVLVTRRSMRTRGWEDCHRSSSPSSTTKTERERRSLPAKANIRRRGMPNDRKYASTALRTSAPPSRTCPDPVWPLSRRPPAPQPRASTFIWTTPDKRPSKNSWAAVTAEGKRRYINEESLPKSARFQSINRVIKQPSS